MRSSEGGELMSQCRDGLRVALCLRGLRRIDGDCAILALLTTAPSDSDALSGGGNLFSMTDGLGRQASESRGVAQTSSLPSHGGRINDKDSGPTVDGKPAARVDVGSSSIGSVGEFRQLAGRECRALRAGESSVVGRSSSCSMILTCPSVLAGPGGGSGWWVTISSSGMGMVWLASAAAVLARVRRLVFGVTVVEKFEVEESVSLVDVQDVEAFGRELRLARPVVLERRRVFVGESVTRFRGRSVRIGEERRVNSSDSV